LKLDLHDLREFAAATAIQQSHSGKVLFGSKMICNFGKQQVRKLYSQGYRYSEQSMTFLNSIPGGTDYYFSSGFDRSQSYPYSYCPRNSIYPYFLPLQPIPEEGELQDLDSGEPHLEDDFHRTHHESSQHLECLESLTSALRN